MKYWRHKLARILIGKDGYAQNLSVVCGELVFTGTGSATLVNVEVLPEGGLLPIPSCALHSFIAELLEALKNLSDAADEVNGEQDKRLYYKRHKSRFLWPNSYAEPVEIKESLWRNLNAAICNAQTVLRNHKDLP